MNKTWVEISKSNLIHNTKELRRVVDTDIKMMSVVKSNAYGHGLVEVASILNKKFKDEMMRKKYKWDKKMDGAHYIGLKWKV